MATAALTNKAQRISNHPTKRETSPPTRNPSSSPQFGPGEAGAGAGNKPLPVICSDGGETRSPFRCQPWPEYIHLQQYPDQTSRLLINEGIKCFTVLARTDTPDAVADALRPQNSKSLKQLTFVGKKSIPSALRKDIWAPLASVEFPFPAIGLKTFKKMREFKRLHETAYSKDLVKGKTKKEKKTILMNQKANSIADLAASLEWEIEKANKEYEEMKGKKNQPPPVKQDQVVVRWHDICDAQYAEKWPGLVVHHVAERAERYTAPKAYRVLEAPAETPKKSEVAAA